MIKKLRRKFVIVSITVVFAVLFVLAIAINIANYIKINEHSNEVLALLCENDGLFPKMDGQQRNRTPPLKLSPETPFATRFFTVKIDNDGVLLADTGRITLSSTEALGFANEAMLGGKTKGFVDNYKYEITQKEYGTLYTVPQKLNTDLQN